ncbi:MAG: type II asparaginase [Treponema sp.]|nr:type II asparaginase [Treponema sp.]
MKKIGRFLMAAVFIGFSAYAASAKEKLPVVYILATGGTIAGSAASSTQVTGYEAGALGVQTLIDAVPAITELADVKGEQICNVGSPNVTTENWLTIAKRCNEVLKDKDVSGVVVTHGTDTLEETAYFLHLTVRSEKPVIVIGAMRPATAISADGPMNLLNAVKLASSPKGVGKGVMITMNDTIVSARDVVKTNTTNCDTFKAPEIGCMGYFTSGEPYFYSVSTRKSTSASEFDVSKLTTLPKVEIVYSYIDADPAIIDYCASIGVKGIVTAGSGMGSLSKPQKAACEEIQKKGVVTVRSTRVQNGQVVKAAGSKPDGYVYADNLNPQKARILLQLALTKTSDPAKIQQYFNEY